jgi:hypothetical protein
MVSVTITNEETIMNETTITITMMRTTTDMDSRPAKILSLILVAGI